MTRLLLICLLLATPAKSLLAQTNFSTWSALESAEFGFRLNFPESWQVMETESGRFTFRNPNANLGLFILRVEVCADSADAASRFLKMKESVKDGRLNESGERSVLSYRSTVLNDGQDMEVYNWVFKFGPHLYHCSYQYPASERNAPRIKEELNMAFSLVESLIFL